MNQDEIKDATITELTACVKHLEASLIAAKKMVPEPVESGEFAELRRLAMAATPGPWHWGGTPVSGGDEALEICRANINATAQPGLHFCEVFLDDGRRTALVGNGPTSIHNAAWIAAANPAAILRLLDVAELAHAWSVAAEVAATAAQPIAPPSTMEGFLLAAMRRALTLIDASPSGAKRCLQMAIGGDAHVAQPIADVSAPTDNVIAFGASLLGHASDTDGMDDNEARAWVRARWLEWHVAQAADVSAPSEAAAIDVTNICEIDRSSDMNVAVKFKSTRAASKFILELGALLDAHLLRSSTPAGDEDHDCGSNGKRLRAIAAMVGRTYGMTDEQIDACRFSILGDIRRALAAQPVPVSADVSAPTDERAAFETWIQSRYGDRAGPEYTRSSNGHYVYSHVQKDWTTWQAARATPSTPPDA